MKPEQLLLCILIVVQGCSCARILGIVPTPSISHQLPLRLIMSALHERGHDITVITTDPLRKNLSRYAEVDISFTYEIWRTTFDFAAMSELSAVEFLEGMLPMGAVLAEEQLKSQQLQDFIKSDQKFDVVIMEALMYHAYYGLIHKVGSPPIIGYLSLGIPISAYNSIGNPNNPAYAPDFLMGYTDQMSFWERAHSLYYHYKFCDLWYNTVIPAQEKLMRKYFGPDPPPVWETERNTSLLMSNNHWIMNYPRPHLPSVIELTGLHIHETRQPLPKELQEFLDGAENGVIYFSLGTNVLSRLLPDEKRRIFIETFSDLPQRVLWKWEEDYLPGKPENVMVSKWVPQQDVLAHRNVKLFITQGGLQSLNEATYFSVPLVAIPFFSDQANNVAKIVKSGIGRRLEYRDLTKESLLESIRTVLEDPRYREAMGNLSDAYHDEPRRSKERAVWWVEYVLRHNGAKHLRSAALDLHWTQLLLLDVIALGLFTLITVLLIVAMLCRRLFTSKASHTHAIKTKHKKN